MIFLVFGWSSGGLEKQENSTRVALLGPYRKFLRGPYKVLEELANTAWAFATAGQSDAALFASLARAAEQHMADFNPQDWANYY